MALTDEQRIGIAQRWFDCVNTGRVDLMDAYVTPDVVDHSGLSVGHGGGVDGLKQAVMQLRSVMPDWQSQIDDVQVNGDLVRIQHSGSGTVPGVFSHVIGAPATDPAMGTMEFQMASTVRVDDTGKIVEHWLEQGPFGQKAQPPSAGPPDSPEWPVAPQPWDVSATQRPVVDAGTASVEDNKAFLRSYVANVIDAQNPSLAPTYFASNFYNHDRAPGEQPGLVGVTNFLGSIFAAFSGFQTAVEEQIASGDLVVGRWSQHFTNTGPYASFPATGKAIHIGGITITRVRNGKIVEEWEARDAVSLLNQMGVVPPLGPLEDEAVDDANTLITQTFFYDIWDAGNVALANTVFAPDFANHILLNGQKPGVDGVIQLVNAFRSAFPDGSVSVDLTIAEGERVATRYTFRGTHRNRFLGIAATHKPVEITGITIYRVADSQITEAWGYWDQASLLQQLGAVQW